MFRVMAKQCDQCLYTKNKIVSDERRDEVLSEIRAKDCHFICHKASIAGEDVCCRGDWDARAGGQMGRIAGRLNVVEFVDESTFKRRK